jgi:PAS domain S-box-containing protein
LSFLYPSTRASEYGVVLLCLGTVFTVLAPLSHSQESLARKASVNLTVAAPSFQFVIQHKALILLGTAGFFQQPTVTLHFSYLISGAIVLLVFQSFLLAGLLWQRARNRRSETKLTDTEDRFRVIADMSPALIWMSDQKGRITYLNRRSLEFTGASSEAVLGTAWSTYIHPDDSPDLLAANSQALDDHKAWSKEYRLRRSDGTYRWMFDVGTPRFNGKGEVVGFIGSAVDVSDQIAAKEALERLGGRLIEAQEKERKRIARELHDDICQRLAMLSHEIENVMEDTNKGQPRLDDRMQELWQHCTNIGGDVQALSHELHSSVLDFLGLVAAVRNFCRELAQQKGVVIDFTHENVPVPLSRDRSLCLFRVVQEALHNAVKYSGVKHFAVRLRGVRDGIQVEIKDEGDGFDTLRVQNNGGLGLISMQERVMLVDGQITIDSKRGCGTTVRAYVPTVVQARAMTAQAARA